MEYKMKYLIDCDIDFSTMKHEIGKKNLISYRNHSNKTKKAFNKIINSSKRLQTICSSMTSDIKSIGNIHLYSGLYTRYACTRIIRDIGQIIEELLLSIICNEKTPIFAGLLRQLNEFITAYFIISANGDDYATLYLNHPNVLEYVSSSKIKSFNVDDEFQKTYEMCVNIFSAKHSVSFLEAEKIYKQVNGWAYGVVLNDNGERLNRISNKKLRESVYKVEDSIWGQLFHTLDMMIHPSAAYLLYLDPDKKETSLDTKATLTVLFTLANMVLEHFAGMLSPKSYEREIVENCDKKLREVDLDSLLARMVITDDYSIINAYNRKCHKVVEIDKLCYEKIVLKNEFRTGWFTYEDYLHYNLFRKSEVEHIALSSLDYLFTISETNYLNMVNKVMNEVPDSYKILNFSLFYCTLSKLLNNIATVYSFGSKTLFQKLVRMFIEYVGVMVFLGESDEETNIKFFEQAFLILEGTVLDYRLDKVEKKKVLDKMVNRIGNVDDDSLSRISSLFGWTANLNSKKNVVTKNISFFVSLIRNRVDPKSGIFDAVFTDTNNVLHGGLFGSEINNDLLDSHMLISDYVNISYTCMDIVNKAYVEILNEIGNKKMVQSVYLLHIVLTEHIEKFNEKILAH